MLPMFSARAPWWMFLIAASFIGLHLLIPYIIIWGPADPGGWKTVFEHGMMRIHALEHGDPSVIPGLRTGDLVTAVNGQPLRNSHDWAAILANGEVGRTQKWEILREGHTLKIDVVPVRATWQNRLANGYIVYVGLALFCFFLGLLIAFRRPDALDARIGAWFITTASVAFGMPNGWAAVWRQIPLPVQILLWISELSRFVIEGIFLSFFVVFPGRLFHRRWPWIVIWIPVLATLPWRILGFYSVIYRPGHASPVPGWLSEVTFVRTMVYLAFAVVIIFISYHRMADRNQRRRVRVLMVGTAVGLVAAIPVVWTFNFSGYGLDPKYFAVAASFIPAVLFCPLTFAYAILRHRIMDIQVIIRQGLQYAFARGAVLGVLPLLGAILIFDLAINSQEPLAHILRLRGWIYAGLGGLAFAAYHRRKPWLEAIDRRFFRERYDAQRLLLEVVEEIREAKSFERVSPRVIARIDKALHPEFVSLMVRRPGEPSYCALASVPAGHAPAPLPADSKIVALARVLGKPLEVMHADSAWLEKRLPLEEITSIRQARIDLIVPIAITAQGSEALLALGIKRSEEPYTHEDQELVEAISASMALLFEQESPAIERTAQGFEECPECGTCCSTGVEKCPVEGAGLIHARLPRVLAGRYYLERRCGRGGMGMVYEATDRALERKVAIKVIREDWVHDFEAAQRFQREARASASFAHPNVVTVHDYGVEAGTRAFLVMELLHGVTLRDELKSRQRLSSEGVIDIFRGVSSALEAAHRRHLIHRDLKPGNIFLTQTLDGGKGPVKVLDFGIAKSLIASDRLTAAPTTLETDAGVLIGTAGYMSPEQLLGEKPSVDWDLWALAVVVYQTLTGALPFPLSQGESWKLSVISGRYSPLINHLSDPPAEWQEFFHHCFSTDRATRPQSAEQFFRELEHALTVRTS